MKHLFLLLVLLAVAYIGWSVSEAKARKSGMRFLTYHAIRVGGLVLLLLLLMAAAVYLPSTQLI